MPDGCVFQDFLIQWRYLVKFGVLRDEIFLVLGDFYKILGSGDLKILGAGKFLENPGFCEIFFKSWVLGGIQKMLGEKLKNPGR